MQLTFFGGRETGGALTLVSRESFLTKVLYTKRRKYLGERFISQEEEEGKEE